MTDRTHVSGAAPNANLPAGAASPDDRAGVVVVRASIAPLHAEPRVSSPQVSQRLAGHSVRVEATDGDWLRVRGDDDYAGWMHRGYAEAPDSGDAAESAERVLSLGCIALDEATGSRRALPLAAWLRRAERVESGEVVESAARASAFPRDAGAIAATAFDRFSGTPYQWGGVTPWGADCSGLIQTAFWMHGVDLPRDAWQQATIGVDAGRDIMKMAPADLLFFSDRADQRITHVGMALGASRMVHLALGRGGYAVERLDARDDPYVSALVNRFVAARRVL